MTHAIPVRAEDYLGPASGALIFIVLMSLIREPARRNFNAILVGGAMGAYISGGLGGWELAFSAIGVVVAYQGLRSYPSIGVAWLMHSTWDLVHHFFGNPIWPFLATSSFGCCIFDAVIAVWFLAGAPCVVAKVRHQEASPQQPLVLAAKLTSASRKGATASLKPEDIASSLTLPIVGICGAAVAAVILWVLTR